MNGASNNVSMPRWYQDLSIPQMQNVFSLGDIMRADYAEQVTSRTQRALGDIGIVSTFVKITPEQIKKLRRATDLDPVKFLYEIYRFVTGQYFTQEEYKKGYDCNERIILSAIAFLTLPETVIELHRRLPMGAAPKFPPKPVPQRVTPRIRGKSPYVEPFFTRPDWLTYKRELFLWRQKCERIPVPRVILPSFLPYRGSNLVTSSIEKRDKIHAPKNESQESYRSEITDKGDDYEPQYGPIDKPPDGPDESTRNEAVPRQQRESHSSSQGEEKIDDEIRAKKGTTTKNKFGRGTKSLSRENIERKSKLSGEKRRSTHASKGKKKSQPLSKTIFRSSKRRGEQSKITDENSGTCESLDRKYPYAERKLNDDMKESHLIVTGVTENEDLTNFPISRETGGIAYVTPENSDENFFHALRLNTKKSYPRGRENLSRKWQEWFRDTEEEFIRIEKEANKIIKSVETTLKLSGPEPICDGCCSCRQTRKAEIKYRSTKTPRTVIDTIAMDGERDRYVIGSLAMNSPGPSPSESTANLPEVIDSHDKIITNKVIDGVTIDKEGMRYCMAGIVKRVERVHKRILSDSRLKKTIKNVPPCGCSIEKRARDGASDVASDDNIPWTREAGVCMGKKYRPLEIGASSCRDYPGDKSCRRNPFKKKMDKQIYEMYRRKERSEEDTYPSERKMYSLAAFQPCGDEDGMAVCGGPWGAVNVPDEQELARREAEAKMIRESPPCGDKPGRAICGAPFGARHPVPKKRKKDNDDEDEEEPEDDEEEIKKTTREPRKRAVEEIKVKHLNRDNHCSAAISETPRMTERTGESSSGSAMKIKHYRASDKTRMARKRKSTREKGENSNVSHEQGSMSKTEMSDENFSDARSREMSDKKILPDRRRRRSDEVKKLKREWNRKKIMASKLVPSSVILPEDPPGKCRRETFDQSTCCKGKTALRVEVLPIEGPFGARTSSERALPVQKTLTYLVESNEPIERIPVRPGGRPCLCRENRNSRKTLLYNVTGITEQDRGKRNENISRVIDGLIYITPPLSVRNSEEYIPEYELYESPYERCSRERKIDEFQYVEKYLGPKSLMRIGPSDPEVCECSSENKKILLPPSEESKVKDYSGASPKSVTSIGQKRWSEACEDKGLVDFYSRCRDNVPCWLRCVEFSKDGCCSIPRRLRVVRPVCECKYEKRYVKREEEKKNWLSRQARLKSQKKQPYARLEGLSRPMLSETKLIISEVFDSPKSESRYGIAGVKRDRVMTHGECVQAGIGMHTPVVTPESSKPALSIAAARSLRSRTIPAGAGTFSESTETLQGPTTTAETSWTDGQKTSVEVDEHIRTKQTSHDRPRVRKFGARTRRDSGPRKRIDRGSSEKKESLNAAEERGGSHGGRNKSIPNRKESANRAKRSNNLAEATTGLANYFSKEADETGVDSEAARMRPSESMEARVETTAVYNTNEVSSIAELKRLLQLELERMASEGFLFAKLPACHLMPQLQYWIMHRKGIALPPEERKNLMARSMKIWESVQMPKKIKAPELQLSNKVTKNLKWNKVFTIKREAEAKRALFYSDLRKSRVLLSRTMWSLMEFGKFPGVAFKRSYFAYQPSKESDGFVFKPWKNSSELDDSKSQV